MKIFRYLKYVLGQKEDEGVITLELNTGLSFKREKYEAVISDKNILELDETNNLPPKTITNILLEENYYLLTSNNTDPPITIRTFLKYFLDIQDFDIEVRFPIVNQKNIGIGLVGNMDGDCLLFSSE